MRRSLTSLLLALLVGLPFGAPISAADGSSSEPAPSVAPEPTPGPTAEPAADPTADPPPSPPLSPLKPRPGPCRIRVRAACRTRTRAGPRDGPHSGSRDRGTRAGNGHGRASRPGRSLHRHACVRRRHGSRVLHRHAARDSIKADRRFTKAVHGFTAHLTGQQRRALQADPSVLAVVPDEVIELTAQSIPTGVSRIGGRSNTVAKIDGTDTRVNADVAIVDTGIAYHPDLNVAGGYNCSTSDRTAWRDVEGHGTHVAGTVGALDNGIGVVGVAPGARVWAVKILNDDGYGLLSWYVCGLDWILAQRDPPTAAGPSSRPST